jgi:hypothetical protein
MSQITTQHFSFADIQRHPKRVIDLLAQQQEFVLLLKREGDEITVSSYPVYSQEINEILEEAIAEHQSLKQGGYDRKRAFQDFRETHQEISKYLEEKR